MTKQHVAGDSQKQKQRAFRFAVALSFPGEYRDYVRQVDSALQKSLSPDKVFYDERYEVEIAGFDADTVVQKIYHDQSELIVVFLCREYMETEWCCEVEWRAIKDLIKRQRSMNILLLRFDDLDISSMPGVYSTDVCPLVRGRSAEKTAQLILSKLRILREECEPRTNSIIPPSPAYHPPRQYDLGPLYVEQEQLFEGREEELRTIADVWRSRDKTIVQIVSGGGFGKSALVRHWLRGLQRDGFPEIYHALGWSFYNQDEHSYMANGIGFFERAWQFYGLLGGPEDKDDETVAREVADAFCRVGGILVLDGLEPLMEFAVDHYRGRILDKGVRELVDNLVSRPALAVNDKSRLLVITTRVQVDTVFSSSVAEYLPLGSLSDEQGARLLRAFRLVREDEPKNLTFKPKSSDDRQFAIEREFRKASAEYEGHPLALLLLASYLINRHRGDLAMRGAVPFQDKKVREPPTRTRTSRHAARIIKAYDDLLKEDDANQLTTACRELLSIIGLIGRPLSHDLLDILLDEPIPELTSALNHMGVRSAIVELQDLRLVKVVTDTGVERITAHPLIKDHFRRDLEANNWEAWKKANERLLGHYNDSVTGEASTLAEFDRLYLAVVHACNAGRFDQAFHLYRSRVSHQDEGRATRRFGVFDLEFSVLSLFFSSTESFRVTGLSSEKDKITAIRALAFCAWKLGQLDDARRGFCKALKRARDIDDDNNAAITARNLVNLLNDQAKFAEALRIGDENLDVSRRTSDKFMAFAIPFSAAMAHLYSGDLSRARSLFDVGLAELREQKGEDARLQGLPLCHYCEMLLQGNEIDRVIELAEEDRKFAEARTWTPNVAFAELIIGRAKLAKAELDSKDSQDVLKQLATAIRHLRAAGRFDSLPVAHLSYARGLLIKVKPDTLKNAREEIAIAAEIAKTSNLFRAEIDAAVELAHWAVTAFTCGNMAYEEARRLLNSARELVNTTGYGMWRPRLNALQENLENLHNAKCGRETTLNS